MQVLQISADIAEASGVGTFVRRIDAELKKLGVDSRIVTSLSDLSSLDVPSDSRPLVVHLHGLWLGLHHAAVKWARTHGAKIVWSTHGMTAPWALHHKWWKKKPVWWLYQKRDLKSADLVHCTTDLEVSWNRALGFEKTCIVPLGTDLPEKTEGTAEGTGGLRGNRVLLFVGRIYPVKALDRIIRAFQLAAHAGWELRIVGPDQGGHKAELERLAGRDVVFAGPKFGADLDREYANCDCAILASHTENFGATIVDGMAHGKPVIAGTRTPWRIVAETGCGWWVDNDPAVLADVLRKMMALSDAERAEMGKRGRELVEERYSWPAVGKAMLAAYGE